jgi:hypothetical protein
MKSTRCLLLILAINLLQPAFAQSQDNYQIYFGTIEAPAAGPDGIGCVWSLKETSVIPRKYKDSGFRYGIQITSTDGKPFHYRTAVELPSPPKTVSGDFSLDNSINSGPTVTSNTYEIDGRTTVIPLWFDEGDPLGTYRLKVFVNDRLLKTFEFTVVDPRNANPGATPNP